MADVHMYPLQSGGDYWLNAISNSFAAANTSLSARHVPVAGESTPNQREIGAGHGFADVHTRSKLPTVEQGDGED